MAWVYLIIAGIFEWGWPVGLKLGLADTGLRWGWIAFAGVCMAASGALLLIALSFRLGRRGREHLPLHLEQSDPAVALAVPDCLIQRDGRCRVG